MASRKKTTQRTKKRIKKSARAAPRWVAVSGGFDPLHIGHVRMFERARKLGDKLLVIVNNDNWLKAKKGFAFMPETERKELIGSFPFVDKVVLTSHAPNDPDRGVVRELKKLRPAIFANGGDRVAGNIPEYVACKEFGIAMKFNIGHGGKVQSSSWMIEAARKPASRSVRPWGEYFSWDKGEGWNLKTIRVKPGMRLSLQYHHRREEWWLLVEGDAQAITKDEDGLHTTELVKGEVFRVLKGQTHRLASRGGGTIVEVAYGDFDENDIVRIEDDHGRISQ